MESAQVLLDLSSLQENFVMLLLRMILALNVIETTGISSESYTTVHLRDQNSLVTGVQVR